MSPFNLHNKTILVTVASSGIGRASAIMASRMGAKLILTGRDISLLNESMGLLAGEGHQCFALDLKNESAIEDLIANCPEIDGSVFAAGVAEVVPFKMISLNHINRIMQINFEAPVLISQALYKNKKLLNGSSLVFITAGAEYISPIGSAIYSASKAALNAYVRSIALEISKMKIRANCVSPGYVNTPMLDKLVIQTSISEFLKLVPLGIIQPEEVASSVIYLLSDASRWITRSTLVVDGGLSIPVRR
jgi:NAD(P)-dependent dehydrogenase (short-subunit alcohol dehydrogenase family)